MRLSLRFLELVFFVSLETLRKSDFTETEFLGAAKKGDVKCVHEKYVNGCNIPLKKPFFYKTAFTPACDQHDVCYFCGEQYGWSRGTCDDNFLRNMETICRRNGYKGNNICSSFARFYYYAVRIVAEENYHVVSPLWCRVTCAKESGDPFTSQLHF